MGYFRRLLPLSLCVLLSSCLQKAKLPEGGEAAAANVQAEPSVGFNQDHNPPPCAPCHTADRPAAPHNQDADCAGCHAYDVFAAPATSYNHNPLPSSCIACHTDLRPPSPHPESGDCASCHEFPFWENIKIGG
ncbi:MAG: hypothetical protein ACOH5I_07955 [Oligoflexus sp.]